MYLAPAAASPRKVFTSELVPVFAFTGGNPVESRDWISTPRKFTLPVLHRHPRNILLVDVMMITGIKLRSCCMLVILANKEISYTPLENQMLK